MRFGHFTVSTSELTLFTLLLYYIFLYGKKKFDNSVERPSIKYANKAVRGPIVKALIIVLPVFLVYYYGEDMVDINKRMHTTNGN